MDKMRLVIKPVSRGDFAPMRGSISLDRNNRMLKAHDFHVLLGRNSYLFLEQADEMLLCISDLIAELIETQLIWPMQNA